MTRFNGGETNSDGMSKGIDNVNGHDGQLSLVEEEEEEGAVGKSILIDSPF